MNFIRDYINGGLKKPDIWICDANQNMLTVISDKLYYDSNVKINLNSIGEISFTINKYFNNKNGTRCKLKAYEVVTEGKFLTANINGLGWFIVKSINENKLTQTKEIILNSIDCELARYRVYGYGSSLDEYDEMSLFKIYDTEDTEHSILHKVLQCVPHWKVGYISPNVSTNAHQILWDDEDCYTFLTDKVANSFECVFIFDIIDFTINVYKATDEQINKPTSINLDKNALKEFSEPWDRSELYTAIKVIGGTDSTTGATFSIEDVNNGSDILVNMEYVKNQFSDSLRNAYDSYIELKKQYDGQYKTLSDNLEAYYTDLYTLQDNVPTHEGVWSEYGLNQLIAEREKNEEIRDLYLDTQMTDKVAYNKAITNYWNICTEFEKRNNEIANKRTQIDDTLQQLNTLNEQLDIKKHLTYEQQLEYNRYYNITSYTNTDYVIDEYTLKEERYSLANELMSEAKNKLAQISIPTFTTDISIVDILNMDAFKNYVDQLDVGCLITIDASENYDAEYIIQARLLEISFSYDKADSLSVVFSNKNNLNDPLSLLEEIQSQANASTNTLSYNMSGIKGAITSSKLFNFSISGDKKLKSQRITTTEKQDWLMDSGGMWLRGIKNNEYSNNVMRICNKGIELSKDNFKADSFGIAIGEFEWKGNTVFGVCAPYLIGTAIIGENCEFVNNGNTMRFDANGETITNGTFTWKVNPNDSCMVQLTKGTDKIMYIDTDTNEFVFSGNIIGSKITGGSLYTEGLSGSIKIENGEIVCQSKHNSRITGISNGFILLKDLSNNKKTTIDNRGMSVYKDNDNFTEIYEDKISTNKIKSNIYAFKNDTYIESATNYLYVNGVNRIAYVSEIPDTSTIWQTMNGLEERISALESRV